MALRKPVVHRRGQQVVGFTVSGDEVGHAQELPMGAGAILTFYYAFRSKQERKSWDFKSDRLLVQCLTNRANSPLEL
jgi:hypothetical protein